ncbi:GNAT family N-acetyltransferase [Pseudonocardia sp. H11422]|uniref:GNAT family N-acetyltransferase n=1 Tax=Pseudonocardia sp. H11422 TaxID=2835866 RepID=UPI001BDC9143|nr:GNAT family N-acetyltransferase [Pseudonocardia sp. H11422]
MLTLERIDPQDGDWDRMDAAADRVVFQTREWLSFLACTQRAEPVVAAVLDRGERVGSFTGLIVRRFGVPILGSPFPGWTTDYMGFNLAPGVRRRDAAAALQKFAFGPLRCVHLELKDRRLRSADLDGLGFEHSPTLTYEVDLGCDEDEMFGRMSSACRRAIRKADKLGVTVEIATDATFADEYYTQLQEVFARQALVPTYDVERVRQLIHWLQPAGRLLLARALAPDGRPIATALFPAFNGTAYFWGGASRRADQIVRPNEMIFWFAMRYWRERGMTTMDLGGAGDYKRKYGVRELRLPWFRSSRYSILSSMRDIAQTAVLRRQSRRGRRLTPS